MRIRWAGLGERRGGSRILQTPFVKVFGSFFVLLFSVILFLVFVSVEREREREREKRRERDRERERQRERR